MKPGDHPRQTSNAVAGVVVAVAERAIDQARADSRNRSRDRHDRSVATPHPDPPPQGGREMCDAGPPPGGPIPHATGVRAQTFPPAEREVRGPQPATRAIPTGGGDGEVGGVDAARDRTVRRQLAARRVAARRPADNPRPPEFAGIEWTNGALP